MKRKHEEGATKMKIVKEGSDKRRFLDASRSNISRKSRKRTNEKGKLRKKSSKN